MSPVAQAYLNELIAVMEAHSVNRLKIDWNSFQTGVMSAAGGAQSVAATFPAIQLAITLLGDSHSFYQPLTGSKSQGPVEPASGRAQACRRCPARSGT